MAQSRPFSLHSEHITNPSSIPLPGEFKEFSLDPQLWQQTCLIVTHLGKVEEALIQRQRGLPELAELVRLRSDVYTQCAGMTWGQALLQPQCLARTNNLAAEVRAHDMEEIVLLFIIPKHTRLQFACKMKATTTTTTPTTTAAAAASAAARTASDQVTLCCGVLRISS
eukprot:5553489-Amphidinium_carterae.3